MGVQIYRSVLFAMFILSCRVLGNPLPVPSGLNDWEFCTTSSDCSNGCCSNQYSDDGQLKCTPGGTICVSNSNNVGISPSGGQTTTSSLLGDWDFCTSNSQCANGCCSNQYSNDGKLKCTPGGTICNGNNAQSNAYTQDPINFSMDDVIQGRHGDCWLESTLAAYANAGTNSPLRNVVQKTSSGFSVTLNGANPVTVTDEQCQNFYQSNCNWNIAIQVAVDGVDANDIDNGANPVQAVKLLTGGTASLFANPFTGTISSGYAVSYSLPSEPDQSSTGCADRGIVLNHSYTLLSIENGSVSLRNPWGRNPNVNSPHTGTVNGAYLTLSVDDFYYCFSAVVQF